MQVPSPADKDARATDWRPLLSSRKARGRARRGRFWGPGSAGQGRGEWSARGWGGSSRAGGTRAPPRGWIQSPAGDASASILSPAREGTEFASADAPVDDGERGGRKAGGGRFPSQQINAKYGGQGEAFGEPQSGLSNPGGARSPSVARFSRSEDAAIEWPERGFCVSRSRISSQFLTVLDPPLPAGRGLADAVLNPDPAGLSFCYSFVPPGLRGQLGIGDLRNRAAVWDGRVGREGASSGFCTLV